MLPRGHALRRGRRSLPGHCYFITLVTRDRQRCFSDPFCARVAARTFLGDDLERHGETLAYVVMPDHVHWLLHLRGHLPEAVRLYKAKVSVCIGRPIWQKGFHDHAVREEENLRQAARYLVANPLRAGLVEQVGDYPYWDAVWL